MGHWSHCTMLNLFVGTMCRSKTLLQGLEQNENKGTSMFVSILVVWFWWMFSYENITFHFVQTNTIASFRKFLHDKFAMTTIVVLVIGVQGEIDGQFELTIADGEASDDIYTLNYNQFCIIFFGRKSNSFLCI